MTALPAPLPTCSDPTRLLTYVNPVGFTDGLPHTNPDPFVLRFRGVYYCYATGNRGVTLGRSANLVEWTDLGYALELEGRSDFWAPCVCYAQGRFWLYVSSRPAGTEDPHEERLMVAVAEVAEGPFEPVSQLADDFLIDPHVVREADGSFSILYASNVLSSADGRIGTRVVVDELVGMTSLAGRPRPAVTASLEQELFARNRFGDGRDWYTLEGPTYLKRNGRHYLTYSGNAYTGTDYFIGYAVGTDPAGSLIRDLAWAKQPDLSTYSPLIRRSDDVEGTGHNSVVKAPNLVDDWIVYHGRDAHDLLDPTTEQRVMYVDRLLTDGPRLVTPAPTSTPQAAPAGPTVWADFQDPRIPDGWTETSGGFVFGDGSARTERDVPALLEQTACLDSFVGEVYVRTRRPGSGRFGVRLALPGTGVVVDVLLDPAAAVVSALVQNGAGATTVAAAHLEQPRSAAWRRLGLRRTPRHLEVSLDDLEVLRIALPPGATRLGLFADHASAEFSALTLTAHLELHGDELAELADELDADRGAVLRGGGLCGGGDDAAIELRSRPLATPVSTAFELELLDRDGSVTHDLAVDDGDAHVVVQLTSDGYRIDSVRHGETISEVDGEEVPTHTTLRSLITQDAVVLTIGTGTHHFPIPAHSRILARTTLSRAIVRTHERTDLPPGTQHHRTTR